MRKYWTLKRCVKEALKYKSKMQWYSKSSKSYTAASRNDWINKCSSHMVKLGSKYERLIYAFEFPDNSVYVGLTYNSKERKAEHLNSKRINKTAVYQHIEKTGLQPMYKELTGYLDVQEASIKEGEFEHKYRDDGWTILNKNKTGGIGGSIRKWTLEKCKEDALKYKSKYEWQRSSAGYQKALKNKWLDECTNHMIRPKVWNFKWTLEKCKEDALKYKSKTEWQKKSTSAYASALNNQLINQCCIHMSHLRKPNGFWTLEKCKEDSLNYKTKSEWQRNSVGYQKARKSKWLDECCSHMK